jgi:hypothetical protein
MNPDTYTFNGDAVTFLGLVGVASTLLIIVTAFRRFYNSPYNVRVKIPAQQGENAPEVSITETEQESPSRYADQP